MSAVDEILWHAGLNKPLDIENMANLSIELWQPSSKARLEAAFDSLMRSLSRLNTELNGVVPSESAQRNGTIPSRLAYAVAEIGRMSREARDKVASPIFRDLIDGKLRRMEVAWLAVLAGDIDDIKGHLEEELGG